MVERYAQHLDIIATNDGASMRSINDFPELLEYYNSYNKLMNTFYIGLMASSSKFVALQTYGNASTTIIIIIISTTTLGHTCSNICIYSYNRWISIH